MSNGFGRLDIAALTILALIVSGIVAAIVSVLLGAALI